NPGAGATPNFTWNDRFYLSPTSVYNSSNAIALGQSTYQGGLSAGGSYTTSFTATLPEGLSGTYYVLVNTDSGNAVFELVKTNNWGASTGTVQISSQPADLIVADVSAPVTALAGSAVLINWNVTNQGTGDTVVGSWQDKL